MKKLNSTNCGDKSTIYMLCKNEILLMDWPNSNQAYINDRTFYPEKFNNISSIHYGK